ncbi:hypothetical protein Q9966_012621 [Columba livia]|nr:hypothetical protein Q9966_012621 [Columba livia]
MLQQMGTRAGCVPSSHRRERMAGAVGAPENPVNRLEGAEHICISPASAEGGRKALVADLEMAKGEIGFILD